MSSNEVPSAPWLAQVALATSRAAALDVSIPSLAQSLVEFGPFHRVWVWSRAGSGAGRLLVAHPRASTRPTALAPGHPVMSTRATMAIGPEHGVFGRLAEFAGLRKGTFVVAPVRSYCVLQLAGPEDLSEDDTASVSWLVEQLVDRAMSDGPAAAHDGRTTLPPDVYEDIFERLPTMVFVKDARTLKFVLINRSAEALMGYSREEVIGHSDADFFPPEEAAFFTANDRQVLATGLLQDIAEEPIQTKHGERFLHTKKIPLNDEDGQPAFLLGISEDITARRQAERQLAELRADLETRVTARTADLETAYRELESFVHAVSHDLRGPVRVIHSFAEILRDEKSDALGESGRPLVDSILGACDRLETLFEGVLSMARISSAPMYVESISISEIAARIAAEACQVHPRQVSVFVEPDMLADADRSMVEVLLSNLLSNAMKFSAPQPGPRIEVVRVEREPGTWCVRDNGVGFDMEHASRLFTPFQRLHDPRRFEGTGIGLATSARIVARHGGRIWAEGEPDHGARFFFTLSGGGSDG